MYKLDGQDYCLYFTDCGNWYVTDCSSVGSGCGGYVWSSSGVGCAHDSARTWEVNGQGTITDMKAVCSGECADDSPAAPTGATASNIGKTAGHIVTYTCDSGSGESKAICDAATLLWKPTSIPSDLCSTAAPAPSPVTAAPSPVTAAPSPVTAAPGATRKSDVKFYNDRSLKFTFSLPTEKQNTRSQRSKKEEGYEKYRLSSTLY